MEDVSAKTLLRRLNGRRFRLEEYTLAETGQFMDAINEAVAKNHAAWQAVGQASMGDLYEKVAESLEGCFELILRHPLDEPADAAFIAGLKLTQRRQLLELQSELNGLEEDGYSKKVWAVLQAVSAWRTATGFAPLPGSVAIASPITTAGSTPDTSRKPGLLARLRDSWRMWRARSGIRTSAT